MALTKEVIKFGSFVVTNQVRGLLCTLQAEDPDLMVVYM